MKIKGMLQKITINTDATAHLRRQLVIAFTDETVVHQLAAIMKKGDAQWITFEAVQPEFGQPESDGKQPALPGVKK